MEGISGKLRHRKRPSIQALQTFDAFPKVPQDYQETSASGGTVSVVVFAFIGILMMSEFIYYRGTELKYTYEVDKDADSKISINVDITVAMKCDDIGADVLDLSGTSIDTESHLKLEETYFKLGKRQQKWRELVYKHQTDGYRTINDVFEMYGTTGGKSLPTYMPPRDEKEFEGEELDSCRISGKLDVNKVAGNFHITAGKSIPHPRGHAHLSALVSDEAQNFSHRIDKLSFGSPIPGVINPLDGDILITTSNQAMFQYYIKIVPTSIKTNQRKLNTHQFSVTQRNRVIDPLARSRGVPGIYFKYDLSSIMVRVTEEGRPFWQFLVRLCGIIGGIFATSGMLHSFVGFLVDQVERNFSSSKNSQSRNGNYDNLSSISNKQPPASSSAPNSPLPQLQPIPEKSTEEVPMSDQFHLVEPEDLSSQQVA